MTPELYKRWRLGLGFVTAKDLAEHLEMAAISISTYESRGSGPSADDKLLRILEKKILERSDEFINTVVDTAIRFGMVPYSQRDASGKIDINDDKTSSQNYDNITDKTMEQRIAELEVRVQLLENSVK
jgi:hypothetical protein